MHPFEAKHISRSRTIILNGPPEVVFPLFTPAGETHWVRDWRPVYLHPASGRTEEGMVFVTKHDREETYWSLVRFDAERGLVRYARVTPGSRFGLVEVICEDGGGMRTRATVTYRYTALTEAGNAFIDGFTAERYREMIDSWQVEIDDYLARSGA